MRLDNRDLYLRTLAPLNSIHLVYVANVPRSPRRIREWRIVDLPITPAFPMRSFRRSTTRNVLLRKLSKTTMFQTNFPPRGQRMRCHESEIILRAIWLGSVKGDIHTLINDSLTLLYSLAKPQTVRCSRLVSHAKAELAGKRKTNRVSTHDSAKLSSTVLGKPVARLSGVHT